MTAPDGSHWVSAIAKRTYAFAPGSKRLSLADVQDPVVALPKLEEREGSADALDDDTDLCATKLFTDVVVRGVVRLPRAAERARAGIAVGNSRRVVELIGPRVALVDLTGRVQFSAPEPFDAVELGARAAYGGFDAFACLAADPRAGRHGLEPVWPYAYPRNQAGVGFLLDMERRRANEMPLPRVEDPDDLLRPTSLFVRDAYQWARCPVPGLLSWVPQWAYPRAARYLGPLAFGGDPKPEAPPREASFADGDDLRDLAPRPGQQALPRCLQGAPAGLAAERLRGDELVILEGLLPESPRTELHLPGEAPALELLVPEVGALSLGRTLQTVRVDLDRRTVSLTWSGAFRLATQCPPEFFETCALRVAWGAA